MKAKSGIVEGLGRGPWRCRLGSHSRLIARAIVVPLIIMSLIVMSCRKSWS